MRVMKVRSQVVNIAVFTLSAVAAGCSSSSVGAASTDGGHLPDATAKHPDSGQPAHPPDAQPGSDAGEDATPSSDAGQGDDAGVDATTTDAAVDADAAMADATSADVSTVDASTHDAASVDATAPPAWTPATLGAPLVLWLDGDQGVISSPCGANTCVELWQDQSGKQNDALSPTTANNPQLAMLQGHGAVRFDGATSSFTVADSPSLRVTTAFTIIAVSFISQSAAAPHLQSIYTKQSVASPYTGPALFSNFHNQGVQPSEERAGIEVDNVDFVASTQSGLVNGALHAYVATYDGSLLTNNLSLRVDDNDPTSTTVSVTAAALAASGVDATIGGAPGAGVSLSGDLSEVMLLNDAISPSDWTSLYAYLKAKYALP
jgi:hypothetical protein